MNKLILRFEDDVSEQEALDSVKDVIALGRISHNDTQYCYHTSFKDGIEVSAFKPSGTTDTFVIYKSDTNLVSEGEIKK